MKHSQKSHSSAGYLNMTIVLFTLLCVLIGGSLSLSLKAKTKTSDEHVTPNSVPGRNGKIAFTNNPGDPYNSDISTTEGDGGSVQPLTDSPRHDHSPRWSPDGTKIAFGSNRDDDEEIYVMNAEGSNETRLTNNPGYDFSAIFSPDGTRIAFGSRRDNNIEIYVMNADGSNQTRLTNDPADDYSHAWSPDSSRIAFARGGHIYVMNADGTNQTSLTTGGSDAFPRFSPDGTRIVFTSAGGTASAGISVMNADGSNQTTLTNRPSSYYNSLDWSPDGSRIAFVNNPDNNNYNYEIYVMNADGSNQTRLTNNSANDHSPVFSPDGTRFAFLSNRDKIDNGWDYNEKIYVMNADGTSQKRLTNTADNVYELEPDWQALPQAAANPIDTVDFFVRQQYLDFLGREPDPPGLAGWLNILNNCGKTIPEPCDRIEVSSAFFRSPEFQGRGYFIYRFYPTIAKVPIYSEFTPDFAKVSGFLTDQELEAAKAAFVIEFMGRSEFLNRYSSTLGIPTAYVDALLQTVGSPSHPSRQSWINALQGNNSAATRAQVLRQLVESAEVYNKYYNEAFVLMQYFGYLRRTADAAYLDWIQTMNQNNGDYRVMINGFVNSIEYRRRFGP